MTEKDQERWLSIAVQRHAHEPDETVRLRKIRRTVLELELEHERIAARLPELDDETRQRIVDSTVLEVLHELGYSADQSWVDAEIDLRIERRELAAREQRAEPKTRARMIARRLAMRAGTLPRHERTVREVATLIATEEEPGPRASAERYAAETLTVLVTMEKFAT